MLEGQKAKSGAVPERLQSLVAAQVRELRERLEGIEAAVARQGRAQQQHVEELVSRLKKGKEIKDLERTVTRASTAARRRLEGAQEHVLATLGVASADEVNQLTREVGRLARKVDQLARKGAKR